MGDSEGLESTSAPAPQFLRERRIAPQGVVRGASTGGARGNERTASMTAVSEPSLGDSSKSPLDKRREEIEHGAGADHDLLYRFTLPTSMPQVLAWVKLLSRVRHGDLQMEVIAFRSGNSDAQGVSRLATRSSKQQGVKLP